MPRRRGSNPTQSVGNRIADAVNAVASVCQTARRTLYATRQHLQQHANVRAGRVGIDEAFLLVNRYLKPTPDTADNLDVHLAAWMVLRSDEPLGTPAHGKQIVRWCTRGHNLAVLAHALRAGVTAQELANHINGTHPLDPESLAFLAALHSERDDAHHQMLLFRLALKKRGQDAALRESAYLNRHTR